ncbi:hypothetical protein AZI86_16665 [Bdellovibrio bacteriovorus]|uniref:Uncharacterized protein n=1 Tax=Bdellovibrio bacteriovorus TaxID=959 RepID=A0A150WHA9_BDEBC|nr:tetratricopeptide repeat protein [Bdellovibrio bacteriovorus]KYG62465.1 hypothetical protein AZI86_16665 [Bdellovibrio bacteriovorus]
MKFLTLLVGCFMVYASNELPNFDKMWNYRNPAETEARFREILPEAEKSGNKDYYLQLLTQIARTQSLQSKFAKAHAILDTVEVKIGPDTPVAEVRYLLERGRTFNSSKKPDLALPLFLKAVDLGIATKQDGYVVDAYHMVAIAEPDIKKQLEWNLKALEFAEKSQDPGARSWLGSLYNNIGYTYIQLNDYKAALSVLQKQVEYYDRLLPQNRYEHQVARWFVARALRGLERNVEALEILRRLEAEFAADSAPDGYVFEEIAENLLVLNHTQEAKKYFGFAYDELTKSDGLIDGDEVRTKRVKELGGR